MKDNLQNISHGRKGFKLETVFNTVQISALLHCNNIRLSAVTMSALKHKAHTFSILKYLNHNLYWKVAVTQ